MSNLTWLKFSQNGLSRIELISDPITDGLLSKECFLSVYQPLMETLDGSDMSSYIDFFFEISRFNNTILLFIDEEARLDFQDLALDLNLIPELIEIMQGESRKDEAKRRVDEAEREILIRSQEIQREKREAKKAAKATKDPKNNLVLQLVQAEQSLEKLQNQLSSMPVEDPKREKLEAKIQRILLLLSKNKTY
jgi:hypothetical protein